MSKSWDEEVLRYLKAGTAATFRFTKHLHPHQGRTWSRYIHDMKHFGDHPDWKICIDLVRDGLYSSNMETIKDAWMVAKFFREYEIFLASPKLHGNVARLTFSYYWLPYGSILFQLLNFKVSLKELNVTTYFESGNWFPEPKFETVTKHLQTLKHLTLTFIDKDVNYRRFPKKDTPKNCARLLLPFCSNVQKISLTSHESYNNLYIVWRKY